MASVAPARAMSRRRPRARVACCWPLLLSSTAAVRRRVAATIRLQPILLAAVEIRVQSKELIKRTARDFL